MTKVAGAVTSIALPRTRFRPASAAHRAIDRFLGEVHRSVDLGLHLGAGGRKIPGLINCDYFDPAADRAINALDLSEFEDSSVDLIENHHMLEHLSFAEADRALREWARVLRPGGWLIITCPDILRVCRQYLLNELRAKLCSTSSRNDYVLKMIVGSQEHDGMFHKSQYDPRRMRKFLPPFGFEIDLIYPYPVQPTPSMLTIARRVIN